MCIMRSQRIEMLICAPFQWTDFRKNLQLFIVTLAAIVPDFDSGIGK